MAIADTADQIWSYLLISASRNDHVQRTWRELGIRSFFTRRAGVESAYCAVGAATRPSMTAATKHLASLADVGMIEAPLRKNAAVLGYPPVAHLTGQVVLVLVDVRVGSRESWGSV